MTDKNIQLDLIEVREWFNKVTEAIDEANYERALSEMGDLNQAVYNLETELRSRVKRDIKAKAQSEQHTKLRHSVTQDPEEFRQEREGRWLG